MKKIASHKNQHKKVRVSKVGKNIYTKVTSILFVIALVAFGVHYIVGTHADANTVKVNFPPVGIAGGSTNTGYFLAGSDGGVFAQGTAQFQGSLPGLKVNVTNIVGITTTAGDKGYWLVGSDGGVFAFGNAQYHGGRPGGNTGSFVGIAGASNGGYWLVDSSGQIYAYNTPSMPITNPTTANSPFVGIASTLDGNGFWLVDKDGQVFPYGDAKNMGSPTGVTNIVGITAGANGGYWLVGSDGGVFSYGTGYYGSMGGQHLNAPVVGIQHSSDNKGYWLAASDGGVFAFGDAQFQGSVSYTPPAASGATSAATTQGAPAPAAQNNNGSTLGNQKVSINSPTTSTTSNNTVTVSTSSLPAPTSTSTVTVNAPAIGILSDNTNNGYYELSTDGGVFAQGKAPFEGSATSTGATDIVGMSSPRNANTGYDLVGSDGGVFAYGLPYEGSMGGKKLNEPVVGIATTPDGKGYWLAAGDGGIFSFGDAAYYGSMTGKPLNSPIVGIATTPDGKGYWLVAADGGIFSFGDAGFYGSMGNKTLNKPIVGMAASPDGKGYWLLASDGGIFDFGDAGFYGSMGNQSINGWAVGISSTPDGKGYYIQASDGGVFAFGDAKYQGRLYFPPPTITASAYPDTVYAGSPLGISWQVGNSGGNESSVFLAGQGATGGYSVNDNIKVTPTILGMTNYTLTVVGPGGTDSVEIPVNVVVPPPTDSLFAVPSVINAGSGSLLEWGTANVSGAVISAPGVPGFPLNVPPFGNKLISGLNPGTTYNFTITATNASGTATQGASLTVEAVPPPSKTPANPNQQSCSSANSLSASGVVSSQCVSYTINSSTLVCVDVNYGGPNLQHPPAVNLLTSYFSTTPSVFPGDAAISVNSNSSPITGAHHNNTYCSSLGYGGSTTITNASLVQATLVKPQTLYTILDVRLHTPGQTDILLLY